MDSEYQDRLLYYSSLYYRGDHNSSSILSGWSSESGQLEAYQIYLDVINSDGAIIDLGCGDGRLLQFIIQNSQYKLIPYGVDFQEMSISSAKRNILPQYQNNFFTHNVNDFNIDRSFTFVITNPYYVTETHRYKYLCKWYDMILPGGRLILYEYFGSRNFSVLKEDIKKYNLSNPLQFSNKLTNIICYIK